ncbi:hypothetical protein E8E12_008921 [Didymella heteroderae]|uniref:Uncharacterized protein n=1 Tax=Didymella heteroderae TaxID=1769908 RepID=A0A9P4WZT1_9PLEO|nr:hypothetical protein E8E12_008921 [Didymella heteroderae]
MALPNRVMPPDQPFPHIGYVYRKVTPELIYLDLTRQQHRFLATDQGSGLPQDTENAPVTCGDEATERAYGTTAQTTTIDITRLAEAGKVSATVASLFYDVKSTFVFEMFGKGSFFTKDVFGV